MALSLPTTIAIALSAVGLFMTAMVLLLQGLRPDRRPYLAFAAFCGCFTVYTALAALRFSGVDDDVARMARLAEMGFGIVGMPALVAFACGFVGHWRRLDQAWLAVLAFVLVVYVAAVPTELLLSRETFTHALWTPGGWIEVSDQAMGPLLGVVLIVAVATPPVVASNLIVAVRRGTSGSGAFLAGVVVLSLTGLHDLAVGLGLLPSMYLVGLGFLVMIVSGAISLAADARRRLEDLTAAYAELRRLREVEEKLAQSERLAMIGRMLSGVAHELNNPLTAVVGLTEEFPLDEVPPRMRDRIELVRGLLEDVRGEGRNLEALSLADVVDDVLAVRGDHLRATGIECRVEIDDRDLPVHGDREQLTQLLLNLVLNAEQAVADRPEGTRTIRISTGCDGPDRTLSVEDGGPGIPPEQLARVFDPFFTTKRRQEGTGLGLFLAAATAERHGGRMTAENAPGGGARLTLRLPPVPAEWRSGELPPPAVVRAAVRQAAAGSRAPGPAGDVEHLEGLRIAVVDDEEGVATFLRMALEERGAEVAVAASGAEAIELLPAGHWDAVLCDVIMPDVDGLELLSWARGRDPQLAERFVFITGDVVGSQLWEMTSPPDTPVLQKPFRVRDLLRAIRAVQGHDPAAEQASWDRAVRHP